MKLQEIMPEMFTRSRLLVLDFIQIPEDTPEDESMEHYFTQCEAEGINPRLPENRQRFNDRLLAKTGARYLVSRYGEDRSAMLAGSQIANEGRTLHLGIDIFSKDQEPVYAPCEGEILRADKEPGPHSCGNYVIFKPDHLDIYFRFDHLSSDWPELGRVKQGKQIARLGDYTNGENGGWSRHLHLQALAELPPAHAPLIGYSSKADFAENSQKFPSPMHYIPSWKY